jgi:hypothetical protein
MPDAAERIYRVGTVDGIEAVLKAYEENPTSYYWA